MTRKNVLTRGKKAQAEHLALSNRLEEAQAIYASVCKADPMDVEAWVKLGATQCRLGRYGDAESSARRALKLAPKLAFAQQTLAVALSSQGKLDEASALLDNAIADCPGSSETLVNMARLREQQGRLQEAYTFYHRALDLQPDSAYVFAKRGELLEKEGRLAEAAETIARGLAHDPRDPILNLSAARLDRREGRYAEAVSRLEAVLDQPMANNTCAEIHILLGQLYDRTGTTQKVLPHLIEGKRRVSLETDPSGNARARFIGRVDLARAMLNHGGTGFPNRVSARSGESPIFLIGFPRSGTTLLEQILDSHPQLQSLDEKPIADMMERAFINLTGGGDEALAKLTDQHLSILRRTYWEEAGHHLARRPGQYLVDKLPLNIVRVPLLWRVFPEARFILAIRHPCDVTLSCMMQNFGHNEAMAGLVSLESTADIYARVMDTWRATADCLPLLWQMVRYEDLVADVEHEARALLEFLGLAWSEDVLNHTRHAQERGIINTPSYHQVTQPIFQHAKYRWKRYEREFQPVMATLQPYIECFGYVSE